MEIDYGEERQRAEAFREDCMVPFVEGLKAAGVFRQNGGEKMDCYIPATPEIIAAVDSFCVELLDAAATARRFFIYRVMGYLGDRLKTSAEVGALHGVVSIRMGKSLPLP